MFVSLAKVSGCKGPVGVLFTNAELIELRLPERSAARQTATLAAALSLGLLGAYAATGDLRATLRTMSSQPVEVTLRQVPDHSVYAYDQISQIMFPKKDVLPAGDFWSGIGWRLRVTFTDGSRAEFDLGVVGSGTSKKLTTLLQPILGERVQPVDKLPAEQPPQYLAKKAWQTSEISPESKKFMKQCSKCGDWSPKASEKCGACGGEFNPN